MTAKKSSSRKAAPKRSARTRPEGIRAARAGSDISPEAMSRWVDAGVERYMATAAVAQRLGEVVRHADMPIRAFDTTPAPAPAYRDSPLGNALGSLERRIEEMNCALAELEMAASSILIPTAPEVNAAGQSPGPAIVVSPSVDELHRLTACLERLVNRVNHITGRVQA